MIVSCNAARASSRRPSACSYGGAYGRTEGNSLSGADPECPPQVTPVRVKRHVAVEAQARGTCPHGPRVAVCGLPAGSCQRVFQRGDTSTSMSTSPSMPSTLRSRTCGGSSPMSWPRAPGCKLNASVIATTPDPGAHHGAQHQGILDVVPFPAVGGSRCQPPVPSPRVKQPAEDTGGVESGYAPPVHGALLAHQGGRGAVGQEAVVGDRGRSVIDTSHDHLRPIMFSGPSRASCAPVHRSPRSDGMPMLVVPPGHPSRPGAAGTSRSVPA